mmetsp:Transcript_30364/g.88351  ORF Transcript_30364/g.88351 Transcript_30364/m.88351 type:complete len:389 (-) Transcript_30364:134-1300(-)
MFEAERSVLWRSPSRFSQASPRSATLRVRPSWLSNRFPGLMSRWIRLFPWIWARAPKSCNNQLFFLSGGASSGCVFTLSSQDPRSPPRMSSNATTSLSPSRSTAMPTSLRMFGWTNSVISATSFSMDATSFIFSFGVTADSNFGVFTATSSPEALSVPTTTTPKPPFPSTLALSIRMTRPLSSLTCCTVVRLSRYHSRPTSSRSTMTTAAGVMNSAAGHLCCSAALLLSAGVLVSLRSCSSSFFSTPAILRLPLFLATASGVLPSLSVTSRSAPRECSNRRVSALPPSAAKCTAVHPLVLSSVLSASRLTAPEDTRRWISALSPALAASQRATRGASVLAGPDAPILRGPNRTPPIMMPIAAARRAMTMIITAQWSEPAMSFCRRPGC